MTIRAVAPIGTARSSAFVRRTTGCSYEQVDRPVYAADPRAMEFQRSRIALGLTLGQAARALDLGPADVSGLEHSRSEFADPRDYDRAIEVLRAVAARA